MAQQFDFPETETQLREIQDKLYQHSKEARDAGDRPAFKGLLEIMSAEVTIITAMTVICPFPTRLRTVCFDSRASIRGHTAQSHCLKLYNTNETAGSR